MSKIHTFAARGIHINETPSKEYNKMAILCVLPIDILIYKYKNKLTRMKFQHDYGAKDYEPLSL